MVDLLKVCGGRGDPRRTIQKDPEEILKLVRDLGGSRKDYRKERARAMKAVVSEIYSPSCVTEAIKMMPSSKLQVLHLTSPRATMMEGHGISTSRR